MQRVAASEVLKLLAQHFRSLDVRAAVVEDGGGLHLVHLGIRVSMRPVRVVRDHYVQLERKFGPRKGARFKVLWTALPFARLQGVLEQLAGQTLVVEGQEISLARPIDTNTLHGVVSAWPQSELQPLSEARWPSVLFSGGRSPTYDQMLQLCRSAEVVADLQQRTRSRACDGHIDAFLEVINSSRYDRDVFLHVEMPARVIDVGVEGGQVAIRAESARTLRRVKALVEVRDRPDHPPLETIAMALSETKAGEAVAWEGTGPLPKTAAHPYVTVLLRTPEGFEIDEMHGPRPRPAEEPAGSSTKVFTSIFGIPDLREDRVSAAAAEVTEETAFLRLDLLDPGLAVKVGPAFRRRDFEQAVFQAYKEVEVRVRRKARLPDDQVGVSLMRTAFHPQHGPLTDQALVAAERQARCELFAGVIGSFKNPSRHREFDVSAEAATELICLANYLLRIIG